MLILKIDGQSETLDAGNGLPEGCGQRREVAAPDGVGADLPHPGNHPSQEKCSGPPAASLVPKTGTLARTVTSFFRRTSGLSPKSYVPRAPLATPPLTSTVRSIEETWTAPAREKAPSSLKWSVRNEDNAPPSRQRPRISSAHPDAEQESKSTALSRLVGSTPTLGTMLRSPRARSARAAEHRMWATVGPQRDEASRQGADSRES
jgi:hypothetical protein